MDVQHVVVVPGGGRVTRVTDAGAVEVPLRVEQRLDDLAGTLARLLGATGTVVDDRAPAPGAGTLVVGPVDVLDELAAAGADMGWVVGIGLLRLRAVRDAAALGLVAGVADDDLDAWAGEGRGGAVYGSTAVRLPGAAVVATDYVDASDGYARITMPGADDLPTMLAEYLRAV